MISRARNAGRLVLIAALALPVAAVAQAGPGTGPCGTCGRMGGGGPPPRAFDPTTMTTIQGEITDIRRNALGRHEGVHLLVAMGSESVSIHLGPSFYVDAQALKLAKGDRIEVKGSRTTFGGAPAIIAVEVRRGDEVLTLRDGNGIPLWRGRGMGWR